METLWQVHLLGGLHLCSERPGTLQRALTHKSDMLLAYLAYHRQRAHPREELIDLMWPSFGLAAGRLNLHVALTSLRRLLERPGGANGVILLVDHKTVQLNPQGITTDVAAFEASLDAAAHTGEAMRTTGLAKLVGMPTPGYVIWTWGLPLVDGTNGRMPGSGVYRKDGTPMEDMGEQPDVTVPMSAEDWLAERDPQLDKAIEILMK